MDGSPNFFLLIHGWADRNSPIGEQDGRSSPLLGLNDRAMIETWKLFVFRKWQRRELIFHHDGASQVRLTE